MAFGITKEELEAWKQKAKMGQISMITHYWYDPRFPQYKTVTKVACANRKKLMDWGKKYGLKPEWIHERNEYPHFDLIGENEQHILYKEGLAHQLERFKFK
ncbi:hypothetical protein [Evansella halocellulosilytica]|uniref:hypothetical protein n=1 Tax=Evansella halocellulosilytica TaxID=2011013 RepID=UPI000BB8BCB0|nr:hypothetical protein [Evansella halocellulosilytica]